MAKTDMTKTIEKELVEIFMWKQGRFALEVTTLAEHALHQKGYDEWKAKAIARNPNWTPTYWWTGKVDFCAYGPDRLFTFIEIKVSVSDFKSKSGHNLIGHKNYYAVPVEIYDKIKDLVPKHVGIYVYDESKSTKNGHLHCIKRCKKVDSMLDDPEVKHGKTNKDIQLEHMMTALNTRVYRFMCRGYKQPASKVIESARIIKSECLLHMNYGRECEGCPLENKCYADENSYLPYTWKV